MTAWLLRDVRPYGEDAVDVRLVDGVIAEIGTDLPAGDSQVLEGAGGVLLPGLVGRVGVSSPAVVVIGDVAAFAADRIGADRLTGHVSLMADPGR